MIPDFGNGGLWRVKRNLANVSSQNLSMVATLAFLSAEISQSLPASPLISSGST